MSSMVRGRAARVRSLAAECEGGTLLASRRGVEAGGPAGTVHGDTGDELGEGAGAVTPGEGVVAGVADAVAAPLGGGVDGDGSAAGGDGIGVGDVGGAAASCDRLGVRLSKREPADDNAESTRWRAVLTSAKYPEICWPMVPEPRKTLNSTMASSAIVRNRIGCRSGKKTMRATKLTALSHPGKLGSLSISTGYSNSLFCTGSSYRGAGLPLSSIASAI